MLSVVDSSVKKTLNGSIIMGTLFLIDMAPPIVFIPWNKGKKTGIVPPHAFRKDHVSWNKGKKLGPQTEEQKYKSGLAVKNSLKFQMAMKSPEFRKKMSNVFKRIPRAMGDKHWKWRGGRNSEYIRSSIQYNNRKQKLRRKGVVGTHSREEWETLKAKYNYMCLCCKKQEPFIKLSVY